MKSKKVLRWLTCLALAGAMSNVALAEAYSDYTLEERVSMLEEDMKESKEGKVKPYDGQWDIFGYGRTALRASRNNNWNSSSSEPHLDNNLGRLGSESESNYLEIGGSRTWLMENGSWAKVSTRVEYGNDYHFIESSSPDGDDDSTQFELKELFIELGNLGYLPEDHIVWAGRRYYKRMAGAFTDDYFVQSSGIGFGLENPRWSTAFIGVDAEGSTDKPNEDANGTNKNTVYAFDLRYHAIDKWDFQTNLYIDNEDDKPQDQDSNFGFALRATYDLEGYYFLGDGFSNASLIYGQGLVGGAAGTNFGEWVPTDIDDDAKMVRLHSLGVLDIDDKWSVGTELNITWGNDENPWAPDGYKGGFVVRPQYRVNDNFKYIFEGSYGRRDFDVNWGGFEEYDVVAATFAPTFTIDSGFWGRPEIRTFVTYIKDVSGMSSIDGYSSEIFAGVQGEFWF